MPAITITIIESQLRIMAGIPSSIILETNIPTTIFYTLDGSEPTTSSDVAVGAIKLPTTENSVILKAFATDGTTTSPIITQTFSTSTAPLRQPRDKVSGVDTMQGKTFPFSSRSHSPAVNGVYGNTAGITVNDPLRPQIPDGYDGTGTNTPSNYLNEELVNYSVIFSETNAIGQRGHGIGTLPAAVTVVRRDTDQATSSKTSDKLFNAKALVIFQDIREEQPEDMVIVNRPYFNLESPHVRDGALMNTSDTQPTTGSALRQHYNPSTNTMDYYYYDNRTARWIISTVPYTPSNPNIGNYSSIVFPSSKQGAGIVFKWTTGIRRNLF